MKQFIVFYSVENSIRSVFVFAYGAEQAKDQARANLGARAEILDARVLGGLK
jgi:hypothetical protein